MRKAQKLFDRRKQVYDHYMSLEEESYRGKYRTAFEKAKQQAVRKDNSEILSMRAMIPVSKSLKKMVRPCEGSLKLTCCQLILK